MRSALALSALLLLLLPPRSLSDGGEWWPGLRCDPTVPVRPRPGRTSWRDPEQLLRAPPVGATRGALTLNRTLRFQTREHCRCRARARVVPGLYADGAGG